jgi:hypothetical protein
MFEGQLTAYVGGPSVSDSILYSFQGPASLKFAVRPSALRGSWLGLRLGDLTLNENFCSIHSFQAKAGVSLVSSLL